MLGLIEDVPLTLEEKIWIGVGFLGQGIFGARMLVQWIASEKEKKSVIPIAFWYMSVVGATITFAYACWRVDPVFITAQAGGLLVYLRNLMLIHADRKHHRDLVV